ncbi:AbrB/MazE/SpoVT family DNA-binding domain-containing protein [Candidatus Parabeggiatoa sp. HSG14]|uniref:AbrB/MazE/SpoVT family DNA-binding domain-containing protein n=1 Tax=Candidatus Parabeggiatoa sp. HSG14 TaxID=3055593 RepID=UPI0025A88F8B|nr:AbrB/MazE/SpoVT family DNA-binding domain-containing protein [Thiotrichales bacterium HSG14]
METVVLGNQGQLVLPQMIRDIYQWRAGTKFFLWDTGKGVMIKPVSPFPVSQLESSDMPSVYQGTPLSLSDMEKAIDIEAGKHK